MNLNPLIFVVLVMLISGLLGGLVNSYLSDQNTEHPLTTGQHLLVGVVASFMVPLFLNMISGELITNIIGKPDGKTPPDYSKLLVLAGFCLVAAVSSRAFIRTLSEKLLDQVKSANRKADEAKREAEETKDIAKDLVLATAEPDESEERLVENVVVPQLSDNEWLVLRSLATSSYSMRSLSGLSKDTKLNDKSAVNVAITNLLQRELIRQVEATKDGKPRWFISATGRKAVL